MRRRWSTPTTASTAFRRRTRGLRCIAEPAAGNGYGYITYQRSGDDADINDVLYSAMERRALYGIGTGGTSYNVYNGHDNTTDWGNFGNFYGN